MKYVIPWSRILLEKLIVYQSRKFLDFVECEGSLPYSQKPITCPYPEQDNSGPHLAVPSCFFKVHFNIIPSIYRYFEWSLSFRFPLKNCMCFCSPHTNPIPSSTHLIVLDTSPSPPCNISSQIHFLT